MSQPDRHQPTWDRLGAYELDYTGVVRQPDLLAMTVGRALDESSTRGIPLWGARAMARHLANVLGSEPSALHHFAITGDGRIGDVMDEVADLVDGPNCTAFVRICADGLTAFVVQELKRLGLRDAPDEQEGDDA